MYLFTCETLYTCIPVYTCSSFESHCEKKAKLIWITSILTSLDICAQTLFEILTIQIIIQDKKLNNGPQWNFNHTYVLL